MGLAKAGETPQDVGHAFDTTGRRGFSMPTFFEEAQRTPHGKRAS
ncbi:hypothetical protein GCM10007380_22470 [Gottfriedia solisilvae]|uniref:Uncharacterized protein n=1 Tax=Gottfriedia solisilvae TaxID=1516104 RepID=A0A8J3EYW5_9BACI|nr:hypothetical protein GCM10007380_22470 [Gottfriedia solisilvae]